MEHPVRLIVIGLVLLLIGLALPMLIIMGYIPSTLALNFISYTSSVGGLFTGMIGVAYYIVGQRRQQ